MLTRQNIIVNRKRLANYEKAQYLCKNKQDFCDCLSCPEKVIEFASLCDSLGLELSERQVDYYGVELVGQQSPYYVSLEFDGFLSREEIEEYESVFDSSLCDGSLSFYFEPVQLELPYESL